MTKKMKILIGVVLTVLILPIIISYLYPTVEISGAMYGQDLFCFEIYKSGKVDYYMNCGNEIIDELPIDFTGREDSFSAHNRLNIFQKIKINKYAEAIKNSDTGFTDNYKDLVNIYIKIDDEKYCTPAYTFKMFMSGYEALLGNINTDAIELATYLWYNKPLTCGEYWSSEKNEYPFEDMTKDNYEGVMSYYKNRYTQMTNDNIVDEMLKRYCLR